MLEHMLAELEGNRLEVCKLPTAAGGYVRLAVSVNADWYRVLCRNHLGRRRRFPRPRTIIKRRETVAALKRMLAGDRETVYAKRILDVIEYMGWPTDERSPDAAAGPDPVAAVGELAGV